jgi:hypothetical protein
MRESNKMMMRYRIRRIVRIVHQEDHLRDCLLDREELGIRKIVRMYMMKMI